MKLKIDGHIIPALRLDQGARTRDVMELQMQSGFTLKEIREKSRFEVVAVVVMVFLSMSAAGLKPSWESLLDRSLTNDVELIPEPGDEERTKEAMARAGLSAELEGEESLDPLVAATREVAAEPGNRAQRRQSGSKKKSRGSKRK